jgi:hypothetical protein
MSNRRKLRPSEQARQDQNRAEAREIRAKTDSAVIHVTMLDPGTKPCSWCDCPVDVHEGTCPAPCPADAVYEVWLLAAPGQPDFGWPVCERHHGPLAQWMRRRAPGVPVTAFERPILDEDQGPS